MTRHHQSMTAVCIGLAFALVTACTPKPQSPNDNEVAPCDEPQNHACDRVACGANSPIVNTFPVNGMRSNGECNRDGTQLLPGTLNGGVNHACDGMTLAIRDNELVGMRGSDVMEACTGPALVGASFVIRSWAKKDDKYSTLTAHIAEVVPSYRGSASAVPRTAYRVVDDDNHSLCTADASTKARQTLNIPVQDGLTNPPADREVVIPVRSELYDGDGHPIPVDPRWKLTVPEWMHLACVGDALAERSLYGLDTDNALTSRAALTMLVANYCGYLHDTSRGAQIRWSFTDNPNAGAGSDFVEAMWGPDRAYCLSKDPRAIHQEDPPQVPRNPVGDLGFFASKCPECTTPDAWTARAHKCDIHRPLTKPRPAVPDCETCTTNECKGFGLWSYTIPKKAAP